MKHKCHINLELCALWKERAGKPYLRKYLKYSQKKWHQNVHAHVQELFTSWCAIIQKNSIIFWGDFEHLCQYIADLSSSYWSCLFWSLTLRGCGFDCSTSFDHLSSCKWWRWWSWYKWCNLALEYPPVKVKISVGRILRLCWCLLLLVIVMLCPVQCASVQQ